MKYLIAIVLLLATTVARADTVWTYTGNTTSTPNVQRQFGNPCNCALFGSVVLDDNLKPVSWSFTDGTHTLTNVNSTGGINPIDIPGVGAGALFVTWNVYLIGNDGWIIRSNNYGSPFEETDASFNFTNGFTSWLYVQGNQGIWTEIATPEPSALALLVAGLVLIGFIRRIR
jgi:PEP-CTERM motif-containing protein